VRNARAELGLDPGRRLPLIAVSTERAGLLRSQEQQIATLARVDLLVHETLSDLPDQALHFALPGIELYLPLGGVVDLEAERARLRAELTRLAQQIDGLQARLANEQFVARAPAAVVQKERDRLQEQETLRDTLAERLQVLGG
jgi:valyl-tRNA synthetase